MLFDLKIQLNIKTLVFSYDIINDKAVTFDEKLYGKICEACYIESFCTYISINSLIAFINLFGNQPINKSKYYRIIRNRKNIKNLDKNLTYYVQKWQSKYVIIPKFLQFALLDCIDSYIFLLQHYKNDKLSSQKKFF